MKKAFTYRLAALVVGGTIALSGCYGDNESLAGQQSTGAQTTSQQTTEQPTTAQTTEQPTTEQPTTEQPTTEQPTSASPTNEPQGEEVTINETFTDSETADKITIVSARRHQKTEYWDAKDNPGGEMVWLQVKMQPGGKYTGFVEDRFFSLKDADGDSVKPTFFADKEIKAAGLKTFDMQSRRDGQASGWIGFYVKKTADSLEGTYERPQGKVIGENKTVPAFTKTFTIGK